MAVEKKASKKRQLRKSQTVRERAEQASIPKKARRIRQAGTKAARPIKTIVQVGRKEYYLPVPNNKVGRFLNKKRRFIPSYFHESVNELRQVKWPTGRETIKLTIAVFLFAFFFGAIITMADYGLDKVFKSLILK